MTRLNQSYYVAEYLSVLVHETPPTPEARFLGRSELAQARQVLA